MSSLNQCAFIGNLGADPEIRTMTSGDRVANLRLAVTERWKKDGEQKEKTEWVSFTVFNEPLVKLCESYLRKGSKLYISGAFQTRKWTDQNGVEKYSSEIVLRPFSGQIVMLDPASKKQDEGAADGGPAPHQSFEIDDEIPF